MAVVLVAVSVMFVAACGDDTPEPSAASGPCGAEGVELDDGLCYVEHEVGEGAEAEKGDVVEVDYTGTLEDGTEFDSSEGRDPIKFTLGVGQVIEGWDKGIVGMKVGGSRTLTIPPELAYGEAGSPPLIPPNSTLIFDVELVSIDSAG
jgi:peptidylprolyl isomerase